MDAGRDVWVKIRASEAQRAEWHATARSAVDERGRARELGGRSHSSAGK